MEGFPLHVLGPFLAYLFDIKENLILLENRNLESILKCRALGPEVTTCYLSHSTLQIGFISVVT